MAYEQKVFDFTFRNTDTLVIPQFAVVCFDQSNPRGCVNAGSPNAGAVIGINQSKGIDPSSGAITTGVQPANTALGTPGQDCLVRLEGISRAIVSAATAVGQPLSVQNASGQVGPGASTFASGGLVGYGLEAGTTAGDVIALLVSPGMQPALKQLGTVAAPLVANAVANTQTSHAHSLGYVPHVVILQPAGATGTGVAYVSATSDTTNIYEKNTVASGTFVAYVA